jgi:hypothetical protein
MLRQRRSCGDRGELLNWEVPLLGLIPLWRLVAP